MPAFHEIRLPEDISYGSSGGPEFSTTVVASLSGFEQRNVNWSAARAKYNVAYGVRTGQQLEALLAFFRARQGKAFGFRYKDWTDYQSAPVITPTDQLLGTGNGVKTTFSLVKNYISGGVSVARTISKPVAGSVRVSLAGTEITSGFAVDNTTGIVTFTTPPTSGVLVKAGFQFDVPVRFDTDSLSATLDSYGITSLQSVPVVEVRL
jgi:uncharacterized protein (TIGR02217 family)